ncbi:transposase [Acetobacter aceti]|uniref:transposase n=1 Tax=Acetobacter aceti TaxID=435 RepID=UPI003570C682
MEVDESYSGRYHKGKRGRGATGKVAVFGLLKRHVHAVMILNAGHQTLMSIIRKKVQPDSIVYSASWPSARGASTSARLQNS